MVLSTTLSRMVAWTESVSILVVQTGNVTRKWSSRATALGQSRSRDPGDPALAHSRRVVAHVGQDR
jgi:hypothetical protein